MVSSSPEIANIHSLEAASIPGTIIIMKKNNP